MKLAALALVAVAACSCAGVQRAASEQARPVDVMIARTLLLDNPACSAVRIGGGKVLTAKHCMEKRVVGDLYGAYKVAYIDADHDFAVLTGDPYSELVTLADAAIGDHVYVVGWPISVDDGKQYLTVTDGVRAGPSVRDEDRITAPAYYGNSGGGVWNDRGELVGVTVEIRPTSATYNDLPAPLVGHTFMVPSRLIRHAI